MNNVVLIGRLTNAVDFRYSPSGNPYCIFTIAVDRGLSKEKKEELQAVNKPTADFLRIMVYGVMAENCKKFLRKGLNVAVQGQIRTGSYIAQDGTRRYTTDIFATKVQFIEWADKTEAETKPFDNFDIGDFELPYQEAPDEEMPF